MRTPGIALGWLLAALAGALAWGASRPAVAQPISARPPVIRPPVIRPPVYRVPEIDPGLSGTGLALLAGGLLILGDRRSRRA